jgi:hypothetical protein
MEREMTDPEDYAPVFYSFSGTQLRPEPYQQAYADNSPYAATASNVPPATASAPTSAYPAPPEQPSASVYSVPPAYPPATAYSAPPDSPSVPAYSVPPEQPPAVAYSAPPVYPPASAYTAPAVPPPVAAYSAPPAYPSAPAYTAPATLPPVTVYSVPPVTAYTVTGIRATTVENGIAITFSDSNLGKNAVLYRNIQPLRGFSDLLTATVVALNTVSPYIDTPPPGIPYYYAVVYEDDIKSGHGELYPGNNTTLTPVEIPLNRNVRIPQTSEIPSHPQPYGGSPYEHHEEPYGERPNGQAGGFYGQTYRGKGETLIIREPHIFNRDMRPAADVADRRLGAIVQGPFAWRDWQTARSNMAAYLAGNPPAAAANRARFYLAQCNYFLGDMRSALSEFLTLQQVYPDEVSTWIQACLNKIADR